MPRRPSIHIDGVPCFVAEEAYHDSRHWLGEALRECSCRLHGYALMTNHVHLLLTPKKAAEVPRLIISLAWRYVQHINTTYRRTGTLWDSRYKSPAIQAETDLLARMRHIEPKPVRTAMVDDPARYRWTSYRSNGLGQADALLARHSLFLALGATDAARRAAYRALFRHQLDAAAIDGIRLAFNQSQPLGNERFVARIERMTGQRREARPRGRPRLQPTGDADMMTGQGTLEL